MRTAIFLFCFVLLFGSYPKAQTPVAIPGSQTLKLRSAIVRDQDYEVQVMLPAGYGKGEKNYPVLYLMDSQWDFPLVTALYGQQYFDGFVPEMIIVGVTWTGKYANPDSLRARDYTPTHVAQTPQSGGAANFLSFLKKELFPFVESRYRIDKSNRTLMGCSLGGLFTLFAYFSEPGLFQRYVAASPAVGWDNEAIYQYEKQYADKTPASPARLYLCVGGVERGVPVFEKFADRLMGRQYKSVQVQKQVLQNIGHSGTKGEGYERGLQYVFERPSVELTAAQLQALSGRYATANGREVSIKAENNRPVLSFGPDNDYTLHASAENELYATAEFLNLHFKKDASGNVTGFELERYGAKQTFSKQK